MFAKISQLFLTTALATQTPQLPQSPAPRDATPPVTVPNFPNSTCPIMGKKASLPLFADTEFGRIYVCCKPCIRKVHADVQQAYETAYPTTIDLANTICPVSGEPIGAQAATLVLQGLRIRLCCDGCIAEARQESQITLAKANGPMLQDLQNRLCPIDGHPVQPNAFAVIGTTIVRLSSPAHLAEVQKAPLAVLDKARKVRAADGQAPVHRHTPTSQPEKHAASDQRSPTAGKEGM